MTKELAEKLTDNFQIYKDSNPKWIGYRYVYMFGCQDGWFDLIWELSEKLETLNQEMIDKIPVEEKAKMLLENKKLGIFIEVVKEKFGTLCVYIENETEEMRELVNKYEAKSKTTCERCGAGGAEMSYDLGWKKILCKKCKKK